MTTATNPILRRRPTYRHGIHHHIHRYDRQVVLQAYRMANSQKPIKLGRSSRWYKSEVESWMQQRIADSRGT